MPYALKLIAAVVATVIIGDPTNNAKQYDNNKYSKQPIPMIHFQIRDVG